MHRLRAEAGQVTGQPDGSHVDQPFAQSRGLLPPVVPSGHHSHPGMAPSELGPCPGGEFTRTACLEAHAQQTRLTAAVPLGGGGHPLGLTDGERRLGDDLAAVVGRGDAPACRSKSRPPSSDSRLFDA